MPPKGQRPLNFGQEYAKLQYSYQKMILSMLSRAYIYCAINMYITWILQLVEVELKQ